jgi:hypothetical protein
MVSTWRPETGKPGDRRNVTCQGVREAMQRVRFAGILFVRPRVCLSEDNPRLFFGIDHDVS